MGTVDSQRKAYDFLLEHLQSQEPFSKEHFQTATGWSDSSFNTYWSKQFKFFMEPAPGDQYRVSEAFRPYVTWRQFRRHVTQVRKVVTSYKPTQYSNVIIYEFFMPLTHEAALRMTLDALFIKDRILSRLRTEGVDVLRSRMQIDSSLNEDAAMDAICEFIADRFVGYSVYHVNGRFRSERLMTLDEVLALEKGGSKYLIDETTAVTRFIFPCKDDDEYEKIAYLFNVLFVRSIVQLVSGEDEIWMLESGLRTRVHKWKIEDSEE